MLNRLERVFASFQRNDVRYLVIGGIAAVLHGVPRATFDLDILIDPSHENAERLLRSLLEAGLGTAALITPEQLLAHESTVFKDWVRIDVQTATPGIEFGPCWERKNTMHFGDQDFHVLCREDLIASKRAAHRPVDLEDVRLLEVPEAGE